jgi:hypothetical protein
MEQEETMTRAVSAGTEPRTAKAAAAEFLQAALAGGPMPAVQVSRLAHEHGLTAKAVRSAREALAVEIERNGFGRGGQSVWSLPGHMDAHPTPPQEGVGASREEPKASENRQPTIDGYEVISLSDAYCGGRGGPVLPMQAQSGPVYLMQGLFKGVGREPLHETCAGYFFEFYSRINKRDGQV